MSSCKYPPGAKEAIAAGCKCPVLDNGHGQGAYIDQDGSPVFWFNFDCPLHGDDEQINPEAVLVPLDT